MMYQGHEAASEDSMLKRGRGMWSPHGLGVRREDGSAVGAGRRRRSQAIWGGGGKLQLKCGDGRKLLVAVGRSSFRRALPFQEGRAPFRRGAPLLLT